MSNPICDTLAKIDYTVSMGDPNYRDPVRDAICPPDPPDGGTTLPTPSNTPLQPYPEPNQQADSFDSNADPAPYPTPDPMPSPDPDPGPAPALDDTSSDCDFGCE